MTDDFEITQEFGADSEGIIPVPDIPDDNPYAGLEHPSYDPMHVEDGTTARAFELMETDPEFARLFQDECLLFLLTADRAHFVDELGYSGKRTADGWLIGPKGEATAFTPRSMITAGIDRVSHQALIKHYRPIRVAAIEELGGLEGIRGLIASVIEARGFSIERMTEPPEGDAFAIKLSTNPAGLSCFETKRILGEVKADVGGLIGKDVSFHVFSDGVEG